jgi:hypothetical protein
MGMGQRAGTGWTGRVLSYLGLEIEIKIKILF